MKGTVKAACLKDPGRKDTLRLESLHFKLLAASALRAETGVVLGEGPFFVLEERVWLEVRIKGCVYPLL